MIIRWLCSLALSLIPFTGYTADIRPHISSSGGYRAIVIEGKIQPGDFESFIKIVEENQGEVSSVFIFSPGGDFYEAMKIGRALRNLELSSQVPMKDERGRPFCSKDTLTTTPSPNDEMNCTAASAAFFIHIGGVNRGGTYLAIHRPYFAIDTFGQLPQSEAKEVFEILQEDARSYMAEMGVPLHIQDDLLDTPSDKILVLDEQTIRTNLWGNLPYRYEWINNRCRIILVEENIRLEQYQNLLRQRNASQIKSYTDLGFTESEWDDYLALREKWDEELDCKVNVSESSRLDAYQNYFGTKPDDSKNQTFSKWTSASEYLGKHFYTLLGEERFEEEDTEHVNFLTRPITTDAPYILLSDSPPSKSKIVTEVSLVSEPNPSIEFTQHLVSSLERAWGEHSAGDGITQWLWNTQEFSAKLILNPKSASGSYLSLNIEEK